MENILHQQNVADNRLEEMNEQLEQNREAISETRDLACNT